MAVSIWLRRQGRDGTCILPEGWSASAEHGFINFHFTGLSEPAGVAPALISLPKGPHPPTSEPMAELPAAGAEPPCSCPTSTPCPCDLQAADPYPMDTGGSFGGRVPGEFTEGVTRGLPEGIPGRVPSWGGSRRRSLEGARGRKGTIDAAGPGPGSASASGRGGPGSAVAAASSGQAEGGRQPRDFRRVIVRPCPAVVDEEYPLYLKYQVAVHGDPPEKVKAPPPPHLPGAAPRPHPHIRPQEIAIPRARN